MALSERQHQILNWVQQTESLSIEALVARYQVSAQTIRKDVNQLAELGLIRRQHGGIALVSTAENLPFDNRQYLNGNAKAAIAASLAQQIPAGASLFLGIGTTVEYVAKALLQHQGLQVFTNNLTVAAILCTSPAIQVRVSGGRLRHRHRDLVGEETLAFIRQYRVDYGILGCGGLEPEWGLLDFDPDEAAVSRTLIEYSRCPILVADQYKWGRKASAHVAPFHALTRFYTDAISAEQQRLLRQEGVQLQLCPES
ncbi:DeoR/GlpR family DNA-binding transcription regulator [Balneatrix alpica]|uniref:DeoR/GlpR family DNA-binding transcription regulator n=1 Tax=Balneatrix alpica TaxID=75684 RepID=UPI002738A916|nr:DeoR/GlpR family DNA-binding transcription regulator [Balneatrix alpica]